MSGGSRGQHKNRHILLARLVNRLTWGTSTQRGDLSGNSMFGQLDARRPRGYEEWPVEQRADLRKVLRVPLGVNANRRQRTGNVTTQHAAPESRQEIVRSLEQRCND